MYIDTLYTEDFTNFPPSLRTGVYAVEGKPHYIVELYVAGSGEPKNVTVYEAVGETVESAGKAYTIERQVTGFGRRTLLSERARKKHPDKVREFKVDNRPLYMSDVEVGRDTFTEHLGEGFRDRTKVDILPQEVAGGSPTGVFITLDSILWQKESIITEKLIEDIRARSRVLLPYG